MKKINPDNSEETKYCPYCMGELALDAVKCSHCGEWVEEKKKRRNRLRREDRETAEREVRRTLQDKTREKMKSDKSVKPKSTQKGVSESKGIKSWWAAQTGVSKGILVLFAGLVVFGGIYLVAGSNQDTPGGDIIDQISDQNDNSSDNKISKDENTPKVNGKTICPLCNGNIWLTCEICKGSGKLTCKACNGSGYISLNPPKTNSSERVIQTQQQKTCESCDGNKKVDCEACEGNGKYKCTRCKGDGYLDPDD